MKGPFETYGDALAAAEVGERIMVRDTWRHEQPWCVMGYTEVQSRPVVDWVTWEIKEAAR